MIFCDITPELVALIKRLACGRCVVDCGCGEGILGEKLRRCISIDMFPQVRKPHILPMNSVYFNFTRQHFPVFLRPCHCAAFVDATLKAHRHNLVNALYVSKPHNLEVDIDTDEFTVTEVDGWTGTEGERAYIVDMDLDGGELRTFYLIKPLFWKRPAWVERVDPIEDEDDYDPDDEDYVPERPYWLNYNGGRLYCSDDHEVLQTAQATCYDDLDYTMIWPVGGDPHGCGWLTPDGTFYGCGYHEHTQVAADLFNKDQWTLEKTHVKVNGLKDELPWYKDGRLTAEQRNWLSRNGYEMEDWA